jgi:hypothetical protein
MERAAEREHEPTMLLRDKAGRDGTIHEAARPVPALRASARTEIAATHSAMAQRPWPTIDAPVPSASAGFDTKQFERILCEDRQHSGEPRDQACEARTSAPHMYDPLPRHHISGPPSNGRGRAITRGTQRPAEPKNMRRIVKTLIIAGIGITAWAARRWVMKRPEPVD